MSHLSHLLVLFLLHLVSNLFQFKYPLLLSVLVDLHPLNLFIFSVATALLPSIGASSLLFIGASADVSSKLNYGSKESGKLLALHVNRKLAPLIFQMSHVGPESIILPLMCFCTLSHTVI